MELPTARAWLGLQSLHYHAEWQRFGLSEPRTLAPPFQPLEPADAVDRLVGYRGPLATWFRLIAAAELCRGSDVQVLSAHFAHYMHLLGQASSLGADDVRQLVALQLEREPGRRFQGALDVLVDDACRVESWQLDAKYCKEAQLSDVTVTAIITRPSSELAPAADPRLWATSFGQLWQRSDTIDPPAQFFERDDDPPGVSRGDAWSSFFFERLSFIALNTVPEVSIAEMRNVLYMDFASTPDSMSQSYRNAASLSSRFPLLSTKTFQGGIDHDSGRGLIAPAPGDPAKTQVVAQKSIRFTRPKESRQFLNETSFTNTIALLELMVLVGACADV
jgi:hypothetical protein